MTQRKTVSLIRKASAPLKRVARLDRPHIVSAALAMAGFSGDCNDLAANLLAKQLTPKLMTQVLLDMLSDLVSWVHVTGTVEDRLILLGTAPHKGVIFSLGAALTTMLPQDESRLLQIKRSHSPYFAQFSCTERQRHRLTFPHVSLIALYHPEQFPLPRFPLGISDMARAIRKQKLGSVSLIDMQFGHSSADILTQLLNERPDIIGISITFGQHDILEQLIAGLASQPDFRPLLIIGGSLAALNCEMLLTTLPVHFVSTGPGERTMQDIVAYWHGDLRKDEIVDVAYLDEEASVVKTRRLNNRQYDDIHPELDLLECTLENGGVMQLESSRGCSYACSFCPREHKGIWSGDDAASIHGLMPDIGAIYQKFPDIDRRIFLVDEEFVGYAIEELSQERCINFAFALRENGFKFETSSRVDQVYRPSKDVAWHINRMRFWETLHQTGLERCLFGVESGVDSILKRFNKKTTSEQNVLALRILTSLNLPIRCTYITFDPLMSFMELRETFEFLGRQDLLMRPTSIPHEQLFDLLSEPIHVAKCQAGIPFYHLVSYMLVTMEGLIGSPYLRMAEEAGLAQDVNPLMGTRELTFLDERVGAISRVCQLWVDRNFSLDYLLKSIEKIANSAARREVRKLRLLLKDAAYEMLALSLFAYDPSTLDNFRGFTVLHKAAQQTRNIGLQDRGGAAVLHSLLENAFADLRPNVLMACDAIYQCIPARFQQPVQEQIKKWSSRNEWRLINGL